MPTDHLSVAQSLAAARQLDGSLHAFSQLFDPPLGGDSAARAFAAKDNFDVEGLPTFAGNRQPIIQVAARHAEAVDRLLRAGFALLGRTRMPQLAYGGSGASQIEPTPLNPRDPRVRRLPGGSSSGSAVAVAAGIVDVALGTDTGGSVRIPASLCGVVGFKPVRHGFPLQGVVPLAPSLDTVGILTRDVATARACWDWLRDPGHPVDVHADERQTPGRVAVARLEDAWECAPAVRQAMEISAAALHEAGYAVERVSLPWDPFAFYTRSSIVLAYEAWQLYGRLTEDSTATFDPLVERRLRTGSLVNASSYAEALAQRERDQRAQYDWLAEFDALVLPTTPITAPAMDAFDENSAILTRFTRAGTWLDVPAISVPSGHDSDGLPVGVQVMTHPRRTLRCLKIAAALERAAAATL